MIMRNAIMTEFGLQIILGNMSVGKLLEVIWQCEGARSAGEAL